MEKGFEVTKDGTTLNIVLGSELSAVNASALTGELSKYYNQGIEKVVFDATRLISLTSAGIRCVFYAYQDLGSQVKIVFINCVKEIYEVLDLVGLTSIIKLEENAEKKIKYRKENLSNLSAREVEEKAKQRRSDLDSFSASNDVVCYTMKLEQED